MCYTETMTASRQAGYTIVEVMIFLVISAALLLSALGMLDGRVARTQFVQSVQALDTKLKTIANESATGTYPSASNFGCAVIGGQTTVVNGSGEQGTRQNCTFVGKVVNLGVAGTGCQAPIANSQCDKAEVYTVIGRRTIDATGTLPNALTGAQGTKPVVVQTINQTFTLGYSMRVTGVFQKTASGNNLVSGLGFFQTINGDYSGGNLGSGSQTVEPWVINSTTAVPTSPLTAATMANTVRQEQMSRINEGGSIVICLRSGSSDQNASITISGATAGGLTTNTVIGDTQCP